MDWRTPPKGFPAEEPRPVQHSATQHTAHHSVHADPVLQVLQNALDSAAQTTEYHWPRNAHLNLHTAHLHYCQSIAYLNCCAVSNHVRCVQDPYGWDMYTEPPRRPLPAKKETGRGDRGRNYTEDAVDRMFSSSATSGARGASGARDGPGRPDSTISKELFSPSAIL